MASVLAQFDAVASGPCGASLAAWATAGTDLGETPIRCPVTESDEAARQRLDIALRMLPGQPVSQWCRQAGDVTAVVRSWPLPARAVSLYDEDGAVTGMVLATGRPHGAADVWRFRFDGACTTVLDRGRRLLPT